MTSRRQALQAIAAAVLSGTLTEASAQHVHHAAAATTGSTGVYKPKLFNATEFETLKQLCEMIVPGATQGKAADFIDLLSSNNKDLAEIYLGGLNWLDRTMEDRTGKTFLKATPEERTALLDVIAYRKNAQGEMGPGVRFFRWARRMTVDAYYSSPAGVKELGFKGNSGMAKFTVPVEAIEYAVKRSGLS
jgi:hypothetical protein